MTEAEQSQTESPLRSDRGTTTISSTVVSTIVGMTAQEVEGVHMGGSASRSAGGLLGNITGSDSQARGVSVEIGSVETALDLTMGIDYGKNILGTVGEVRQKVTERLQSLTGLRVTELNVRIADIVFPEEGSRTRRRSGPDAGSQTAPRGETDSGGRDTGRQTEQQTGRETGETAGATASATTDATAGAAPQQDETRRMNARDTGAENADAESSDDDRTHEIDRRSVSEEEQGAPESRRSRRRRRENG